MGIRLDVSDLFVHPPPVRRLFRGCPSSATPGGKGRSSYVGIRLDGIDLFVRTENALARRPQAEKVARAIWAFGWTK